LKPVEEAWCSEQLLEYLETAAYDNKACVQSDMVQAFLERGADPGVTQNGATALQMVVLNPYSSFDELLRVFHLMLSKAPAVAAVRDGFKLAPLQWAADYVNVAQQHGLAVPNPAALLALMPTVVATLPPEIDAGECCLRAIATGGCPDVPPKNAPPLRFLEGQRVLCRVECPGGEHAWEEGVVIGLWYREACWQADHAGAPYEVRLDISLSVFALVDHDRIIRAAGVAGVRASGAAIGTAGGGAGAGAPGPGAGAGSAAGPAKASRFRKQRRADDEWELLDTVSGKARPCSPPSSDDD